MYADTWYNDVGAKMGRIEQFSNGRIWLMRPTDNNSIITLAGDTESCDVNQIQLIPPVGKEKEWFSMVMSATMAGKALYVYGECIQTSKNINATRLVLEY